MNLTKSDLVNIEAFKQLIKCVVNDIKDVKNSVDTAQNKAYKIFKLYRQKAQLINQASGKYPHINWLNEALGQESGFERSTIETIKMKIEHKFNFN